MRIKLIQKLFFLCVLAITLIAGCQSKSNIVDVEIKLKSVEEQKEILDTYTYDDYKKVFDDVVAESNTFEEDEQLKKWIIRTLGQEKLLYDTDLTDEQVVTLSKKAQKEDEIWKTIAKDKYGITVNKEEVDNYIKEVADTSDLPQHLALAEALGLSLEELNHNFDYDIYEKGTMWIKLKKELGKKYDTTDDNKMVEMYEEEVKKQLN